MRKVIITGGNGFLGCSLAGRLQERGVEVHAVANNNHQKLDLLLPEGRVHVLRLDPYAAAELVTRIQPDAIFHLAAVYAEPESIGDVAAMLNGNLVLGAALLWGASRCEKPAAFINTGTYWQFSEDGKYCPNTVYASTKQAFQDLLFFYEKKGAVSATTLVLYDTFGEGDTRSKLWNALIEAEPGTRFSLSEGDQMIELVHRDDAVNAFLLVADKLLQGEALEPIYSLRSREARTLRDLVNDLDVRAELGLRLEWAARAYWEGIVLRPWQGPLPPGWEPKISVMDELVRMAEAHRAGKAGCL